jgi:glycosyltransferase involved in cell wall biosynthesis
MAPTTHEPPTLKLSICISTFNRANFLRITLDSIIDQLTDECEVLVLNNGSSDSTELMMSEYLRRSDRVRYASKETNCGLDCGFDCAVELARGEYCWLMPDDDLMMPGAIATVLNALRRDLSLVVVNKEIRDLDLSTLLVPRWLTFESDRIYEPGEMDRLFKDVGSFLVYIGAVVIKRAIWLSRERKLYFGSLFIHLAVIFQQPFPGPVRVIVEPLIRYRFGNPHAFSATLMHAIFVTWPSLVSSMALSESAKQTGPGEPWRHLDAMLHWRGRGYSLVEYRQIIHPQLRSTREMLIPVFAALLPGSLVNASFVIYYSIKKKSLLLACMKDSPFYFRRLRPFRAFF